MSGWSTSEAPSLGGRPGFQFEPSTVYQRLASAEMVNVQTKPHDPVRRLTNRDGQSLLQ